MTGVGLGVIRLIVVFIFPAPGYCGAADTRPAFLKDVHYMYYAIIESGATILVAVVISIATKPLHPTHVSTETYVTIQVPPVRSHISYYTKQKPSGLSHDCEGPSLFRSQK